MRKIIVTVLLCLPMVAMAKTNYYTQTNHFALKQGQEWSWGQVVKTPSIKWENKTPKNGGYGYGGGYGVTGQMGKYGSLFVGGTAKKPSIIHFQSSQDYQSYANGDKLYKLHHLFNKLELTKLRSNCAIKRDPEYNEVGAGAEYQNFYKWQKKGYQPLYLAVRELRSEGFGGGITMDYVIVKDFNLFNDSELVVDLTREDSQGNEITCRIL